MKNGLKILIVEDELVTADSIRVCLIDRGYEVTGIATTGEAALTMADDAPPGLVLMDSWLWASTSSDSQFICGYDNR